MRITDLSLRRPLGTFIICGIFLLFGFLSLSRLKMDLFPDIQLPIIAAITNYPGAGPEEVESIVSRIIEEAVATVPNVTEVSSISYAGTSVVMAEANYGADLDYIALTMRERIDLVKPYLPDDVEAPILFKFDPAMMPIIMLGVGGGGDLEAVTRLVNDTVVPRLKRIPGVASVETEGGLVREFRVEVDQARLLSHGLTLPQIESGLRAENLNYPGGVTTQGGTEYLVRSLGLFQSAKDLGDLLLALPRGGTIALREVATIRDDYQEQTKITRINGQPGLALYIQKESDANTVVTARKIRQELAALRRDLGARFTYTAVMDQAEFIERSLGSVYSNAILGALLAVIILWLFLRNMGSTMVIGLSIPISIVVTFALMYFRGMTLNLVSLGGLALGVGMLVDNSIVVLENIHRHRQEGADLMTAAREGTSEVGMAILGSTTTSIVVFLPVFFVEGLAGQIFRDMALTVGFSLLASLAVAVTIVPILSSRLLHIQHSGEDGGRLVLGRVGAALTRIADTITRWLAGLDGNYRRLLRFAIDHRPAVILGGLAALILGMAPALLGFMKTEFLPPGSGAQFSVTLQLPPGRVLRETDRVCREFEEFFSARPEVECVTTVVGSGSSMGSFGASRTTNRGNITVDLKSAHRKRLERIMEETRVYGRRFADVTVEVAASGNMGMMAGEGILVEITGPDLRVLTELAAQVKEVVAAVPGTREVKTSLEEGAPEARLRIDREKAALLGISGAQIASTLRTAYQGSVPTRLRLGGGEEFDVRVILSPKDRERLQDLERFTFVSPRGGLVALSDVADIETTSGPTSIQRKDQTRLVEVTGVLHGRDLGSVSREVESRLGSIHVPEQYRIALGGQAFDMAESFAELGSAMLYAILLVYMVLALQYESLLNPLVILFSIPLMSFGVTWSLFLTGRPLNIPGFAGAIMLTGIVVNNAIVLIDYIEILRRRGMSRVEAVLKAGPTRLRPVLMTTLTTILGVLPLAFGLGEGGEFEAPLATVVAGGLTCSTVLTLVVIPVVYLALHGLAEKIRTAVARRKGAADVALS